MKMKDSGDTLKRALVYTVLGFFTVGVIAAGWLTYGFSGPPRPDAMPDVKMWPRARSTAALPAMRIAGHWPDANTLAWMETAMSTNAAPMTVINAPDVADLKTLVDGLLTQILPRSKVVFRGSRGRLPHFQERIGADWVETPGRDPGDDLHRLRREGRA